MAEMEPEGEINREDVARVAHGWHEVEKAVMFPVVVLQMLYNQHAAAVH